MNWQKRIRDEFEAPTKTVILSFARSGYSMKLTAGALGISRCALRNFCKVNNIEWPDQSKYREECRSFRGKLPRGYSNNPTGVNQWRIAA